MDHRSKQERCHGARSQRFARQQSLSERWLGLLEQNSEPVAEVGRVREARVALFRATSVFVANFWVSQTLPLGRFPNLRPGR